MRDIDRHQDEFQDHDRMRKPSNQEKKRDAEREEISAYFNQRVPDDPTFEAPPGVRPTDKRAFAAEAEHPTGDEGSQQEGSSPMLREEELTAVPYLGFGSKGNNHQSSNPHPSGTSYLTWSESVVNQVPLDTTRPDLLTTRKPGRMPALNEKQHRQPERHQKTTQDTIGSQPAHKHQRKQSHRQWESSRRAKGPANIEAHIPPGVPENEPSTDLRMMRDTTSQSLPTARPKMSQARKHEVPRPREMPSSSPGSFHTSDILKVRERLQALAKQPPSDAKSSLAPQSDKENLGSPSSPMAKVLRMAQGAMLQTQHEALARPPTAARSPKDHFDVDRRENFHYSRRPIQCPLARSPLQSLARHEYAQPPSLVSPSPRDHYVDRQLQQGAQPKHGFANSDDADMLDIYSPHEPEFGGAVGVTVDQPYAFTYAPRGAQSDVHSLSFRYDRPSTRARGIPWSRGGHSTTLRDISSHYMFAERDTPVTEEHAGGQDLDDGLEGFWRPNRLY